LKCPWGENRGPQDRAGSLVGYAEPGDLLPRGQGELLDGVHAPDLVRGATASGLLGRGPPRACRWNPVAAQPALEGARARDLLRGKVGVQGGQLDAEASGAPAWVLLVEAKDGIQQGGASVGLVAAAGGVTGQQGRLSAVAAAPQQDPDGAGGQAQLAGDGGRAEPLRAQAEDGLADPGFMSTRHRISPGGHGRISLAAHSTTPRLRAKLCVRISAQNYVSRHRASPSQLNHSLSAAASVPG
jgi:hypothetical protein